MAGGGNGNGGGSGGYSQAEMDAMSARAVVIHEAMVRFLKRTFPRENPLAVITACSYEIGRIVGTVGDGLSADDREHLIQGVMGVMRQHVNSGLRR